jgi:cytochrome c oxidase cbb3-type subunit 3/ubiquinol-cytochrome c reductase cytochrome c subunit
MIVASCMTVLGCGTLPGKPKPGPEVPRPDSVVDFATLYRENCSGCHGTEGMNGPSYPLANPEYQALVDEQVLHQVVANGLPGTLMPAFSIRAGGSLTDEQVNALVHGMRTAWYKAGAAGGPNPQPYKAAQPADAAHGRQVYATYCASCHGVAGQAGKSKAGSITEPAFLSLVSDQVLRTVVIAGRPDIGQPDWRNTLPGHPMSDQEVTDVVGWLSSLKPGAQQTKTAGGAQ